MPEELNETRTIDRSTTCTVYDRSLADLQSEMAQVDHRAIGSAATSWYSAATLLGDLANRLRDDAGAPLAEAWVAPSSSLSQRQLQLAQATARSLANECMQMAHAMEYTAQVAEWYQTNMPKESSLQAALTAGTGAVNAGAGALVQSKVVSMLDEAAGEHLTNFMQRYRQVVTDALPPQVQQQLMLSHEAKDTVVTTGPGGGGGGGTGGPTVPGGGSIGGITPVQGPGGPQALDPGLLTGTGTGPTGGVGTVGGGVGAGAGPDPYGATSQLAGGGIGGGIGGGLADAGLSTLPAAGSGGLGGIGGGLAGPGGPGISGIGGGLATPGAVGVGGLGGLGAGLRGGPGAGLAGGPLGAAGAARGEGVVGVAGTRGAGTGTAGRAGVGPMMGGHGAGEKEERERSTWLNEDDDVWGGDGPTAPPLITS